MFVGVGDAAVVFFFEGVGRSVRIGIVVNPDDFDELLAFFVGAETLEGGAFFGGDDVDQVFVDEVSEAVTEFVFGFLDLFFVLFFGLRFLRGRHRGRVFLSEHIQAKQKDCGRRESRKAHESPQGLDVGRETHEVR